MALSGTARKSTFAVLAFVLLSLAGIQGAAAATVLRMNHQFPATAAGSKIDAFFAEEVKRLTNGEVQIKIYWANALGAPKENLTLMSNGAIDMAAMSAGYFPAQLPLHAAPNSLPMAMDNIEQASKIMQALTEQIPAFDKETKRNNIISIFFHLLNPYYLVTTKPVQKLEDLQGLKIRTWGEDMPKLVEAAGATPVTIFLPELYENLQRGVIDGCPFSVDLMQTYRIYEVAKHVTEVVMWEGPSWGIWMNRTKWNNLPEEHKAAIVKAAQFARRNELKTTAQAAVNARSFLKKQGVTFHQFPEEDLAQWKAQSPDFFERWIRKMETKGLGKETRRAVDLWKRMRSEIQ